MAIIVIEPPKGDTGEEFRRALEALKKEGISARRRHRSLQSTALIQVPDSDAERAVSILGAAKIRASIRPG
jgi:hypothetical protein